jgi:AcrR family transcriptional regulator
VRSSDAENLEDLTLTDKRRVRKPRAAAKVKNKSKRRRWHRSSGRETEAKLIAVATPLFAKLGFDAVSTRMIAKRAAVTIPVIYLYFSNKRDLYLRCCVEVFGGGAKAMLTALQDSGSPEERVFQTLHALAKALMADANLGHLFQRELLAADKEGLDLLERATMRESFDLLHRTIEEAMGSPVPELTVVSIYALTFGLFQYMHVGNIIEASPKPEDAAEWLARQVARVTLPDIYQRLF